MKLSEAQKRKFNEALRLRDAGKLDDGIAILKGLAVEQPTKGAVWGMLGSLLDQAGRLEEAGNAFEQAVLCSPRSELASISLFHSLMQSDRVREAWQERERFLAVNTDSEEYRLLDEELRAGGFEPGDGA